MAKPPRPPTALDDTGTVHAFFLLGWIPPAVAAIVGGVVVAFATGNVLAFFGVALGGTLAGYVAALVLIFTIGNALGGHVGERVANGFLVSVVAVSVAVALAVAVSASGFEFDPVLADSVAQAMTVAIGLVMVVAILVVGTGALIATIRSWIRRVRRMVGGS